MNNYFTRGSEWRRWDLHVHTKSDDNYKFDSDYSISTREKADEEYPNLFVEYIYSVKDLGLIAITDHDVADWTDRIIEANNRYIDNNRPDHIITILPGVEIETGDGIHLLIIFNPFTDDQLVIDNFRKSTWKETISHFMTKIGNPSNPAALKTTEEILEEAENWDAISIFAHVTGDKGFFNISSGDRKTKLYKHKLTRIFQIPINGIVRHGDNNIVEGNDPNYGNKKIIKITSSDAKCLKDIGQNNCWIKADPTFKGLLQVLTAPDERIYVGDIPPQVQRVRNNSTKYMKSVSIRRKPEARIDETWFDNSIPLNSGMICIIGNKGSGKSALTDIIGLLGNTKQYENFTFLSKETFRQPKDNKSRHFQATMEWESGFTFTKGLDEQIDTNQPELIKYLPQNYLEYICNQIGKIEETEFDKELKNIIFSHIDESNRLGMSSLEELIKFKTSQAEEKRFNLRKELHEINSKIVALEEMSQPEYKIKLINLLAKQKEELDAHDRSKPLEVKRPENDPEKQAYMQYITNQIEKSNVELNICKLDFDNKKHHSSQLNILISQADILIGRLENISTQVQGFINESKDDFARLGVSLDSVLNFSINVEPLKTKKDSLVKEKKQIDESLDPQRPGGLGDKILKIERMIKELQYKLDQPNRLYQQYKTDLMNWESKRNSILGNEETPDTLKYYEKKIRDLESIPGKLQEARGNRKAKTMAIYSVILGLKETYKELYLPVLRFIDTNRFIKETATLSFEVSVVNAGFEEKFFNIINRHVIGTFYGLEEGHQKLSELLSSHDFDTEQGLEFFLNNIIYAIEHDIREGKKEIRVKDQLRKGQTVEMLYDLIFSLEYLRPRYSLRMADKELSQLSPGERGTLLLLFYLLVDKDDRPLVIDQPEENLDNQTVYEQLVNSIKKAKKRRQIIFVTHNPNIAVVCDAEQIIHAHLDKKNNFKMNYTSGSLENPIINKAVLDILEGTRPAFKKRDEKYF